MGSHDQEGQVEGFHDVSHGKRVIYFIGKTADTVKMMPEWWICKTKC